MQKKELKQQIEEQTALIAELEKSFPKRDDTVDRWHENNRPYEIHHVKVRDAYWKRRMLITRLEEGAVSKTAAVY
ncbi:MAG: hypothetical protein DWQ19_12935 [Crenarchaeota archaeon]|nr:MAG: hypothetical protein DWQ19_12935 [Thermoproteota archaeon]